MEHPEKDWFEDLRIERTKKRRLKKREQRHSHSLTERNEQRADAKKSLKCRGRGAQA